MAKLLVMSAESIETRNLCIVDTDKLIVSRATPADFATAFNEVKEELAITKIALSDAISARVAGTLQGVDIVK